MERGLKQKIGNLVSIRDDGTLATQPFRGESSYKAQHSSKGVKEVVTEKPINSLYCPKEMRILEKLSSKNKHFDS